MKIPKVAIIVLQYNQSAYTLKCLEALRAFDAQIIVVDNGSDVEHVKNVDFWIVSRKMTNYELLMSNENLGYSGGNNLGIKKALKDGAEEILILNNDVVLDELPRGDADIVGVQEGTGIFGHRYLVGFALLIKRAVFEKMGLFDERYFLYYDEVEFCARAQKYGFTLGVVDARMKHAVSVTTSTLGPATLLYYHRRNALLFYNTYGPWWVIVALPFWRLWTTLKQQVKILLGRDTQISRAILQAFKDYENNRFGMRVE